MNINLSTVTDSPKATKASLESSAEISEDGSSEGFFSKLSAFIKGESAEGEKSVKPDSAEASSVDSESEESVDVIKASKVENSSTDELLSSENDEVVVKAKQHSGKPQGDNEPNPNLKAEQEESDSLKALPQAEKTASNDAEQIVADNKEILKRLDQANSTLQSNNGKALPLDESGEVEVKPATNKTEDIAAVSGAAVMTSRDQLTENKLQQTPLIEDEVPVSSVPKVVEREQMSAKSTDLESQTESGDVAKAVAIPAAVKPFIETDNSAPLTEQVVSTDVTTVEGENPIAARTMVAMGVQQAVASEQDEAELATQLNTTQHKVVDSEMDELEQLEAASKSQVVANSAEQQDVVEQATTTDQQGEEVSVAPVITASAAVTNATKTEAETTKAEFKNSPELTVQTRVSDANVTDTVPVGSEVPVAAAVTAAAIPWAVNSDDVVVSDDVFLQPKQTHAQQAVVAQSVHQALTQSQASQIASATQINTAMPVPGAGTDVVASQVQAMVSAPVTATSNPVVAEQAMLKAAMGAKAAGTLLNNSNTTKGEQSSSSESGFAQQLAQAAGVQQANTPLGQVRAEQAAQVPLQLNREMASDQVAERVQMMMSKNLKNIDIRLDPPELGRMQIRMNMNGDGATVHFTVANQQARDALEQSMPRLREMLAQQGVQLGDTSVQQQSSGQQQNRYAANGQGQAGQPNSNQAGLGEENLEPDINLDLNVAAKRDGISYYA